MKNIKKYIAVIAVALPFLGLCTSCSDDDKEIPVPQPTATGTYLDERDSTEYAYVQYGDLQWMTTNVKFQTKANKLYPDFTDPSTSRMQYYVDPANRNYYDQFGGLYTYAAAQEATPEGWRIPTKADWEALQNVVGSQNITKAIKLTYGGFYNPVERNMSINDLTYVYGYYWMATENDESTDASFIRVFNKGGEPFCSSMSKSYTLNLRCVRNVK